MHSFGLGLSYYIIVIRIVRLIQDVPYGSNLVFFFSLLYSIRFHEYTKNYLSILSADGHLGSFWVLTIVNSAAINMSMYVI